MNNIVCLGRLGGDPQVNTTNNGTQVVKFSLACNNSYRQDDGTYGTNWYNCSIFGKRGEVVAKNFHKGDPILISGDLVVRRYNDKNGVERTAVDINVSDFSFVGKKSDNAATGQPVQQTPAPVPQPQYAQPAPQYNAADDLPF